MKTIQLYIDAKQQEFNQHPFFKLLEQLNTAEEENYFIPELTFWAMTFQDILRINETRVSDPYLKKVARHHRLEDAGHEQWFLYDKKYLSDLVHQENKDGVAWLYSKDNQTTRDAAYAIMSEIYRADDELINIALLLTLESSGHVFFEKVANQMKKVGQNDNLKYFSTSHLDVEMAHALFEEEMERNLFERPIKASVQRKALAMIDRCYAAFNQMFDGLIIACNNKLVLAQQRNAQNAMDYEVDKAV